MLVVRRRIVTLIPLAVSLASRAGEDVRPSLVVRFIAAALRSSWMPLGVVPSPPPPVGGIERSTSKTTPLATRATRTSGKEPGGRGTGQECNKSED